MKGLDEVLKRSPDKLKEREKRVVVRAELVINLRSDLTPEMEEGVKQNSRVFYK